MRTTRIPHPLEIARQYPHFRFMGSKYRLIPWIYEVLRDLSFTTAFDAFSGSGVVAYLLKAMGKHVITNDFLRFAYHIAHGLVVNPGHQITKKELERLLRDNPEADTFIQDTFHGIFFTPEELKFLDHVWANLQELSNPYKRSLALSALVRACIKRQPRGVFTVGNDRTKAYHDGRRDLKKDLRDHFVENVRLMNQIVYDDGRSHQAFCSDIFDLSLDMNPDLVYMDPPYVPRRDDNDYIKRYHFVEGLVTYWKNTPILHKSKVKKSRKSTPPFHTEKQPFGLLINSFGNSPQAFSFFLTPAMHTPTSTISYGLWNATKNV